MQRHIAICHRDHGDLQLVRPRGEGEQYSKDIVDPCTKRQPECGTRWPGAGDSLPGSVSIMMRFFGAMACLRSEIGFRPSQREVRVFHVDLALCLVSVFVSVHSPALARSPDAVEQDRRELEMSTHWPTDTYTDREPGIWNLRTT